MCRTARLRHGQGSGYANMKKAERYNFVVNYFRENGAGAETELQFRNPYELIVAVVLSAQCTDRRVNQITPELFAAYPTVRDLAQAAPEEIFRYVKSVSYPNAKARRLSEMARMLAGNFNGVVPDNFEELTSLPGVGRKTANVVLSVAFGKAVLAVDTHVFRVSRRLGLVPVSCDTPEKVENELTRNLPCDVIGTSHHWLLLHGRYICKSRRPECEKCALAPACRHYAAMKGAAPQSKKRAT